MKTKIQSRNSYTCISVVALLLALNPATLWGQAVSNPNQITGTISFSNTNPDILAILNSSSDIPPGQDQGFLWWGLIAFSVDISPTLFNSAGASVSPHRISTAYSVTVESAPAPAGIRYEVTPHSMILGQLPDDFTGDFYAFAPAESPPVFPEPAADAVLNFSECAGLLDIRWVDESGDLAPITGGSIQAFRETAHRSGTFLPERTSGRPQGWKVSIPPGRTQEYLAVRGDGARYQVNVTFELGADSFSDKVRSLSQHIVVVNCDEIVRLDCVVPSAGLTGEIVGRVDMLGENEHRFGGFTGMVADQGPFDNFRLDTVLASPSQGLFRLENLVPSDAVTPSRGYRVYGEMSFRLGRRYEYFATPFLGERFGPGINTNPRVLVTAGAVTDLTDKFVLAAGFVRGNIVLAGPPAGPNGSCLEDLLFDADRDADANGIPDDPRITHLSIVGASGTPTLPAGATLFSEGAFAQVGFDGSFNPATESFEGDYEIVLGSLKQEPSIWRFNPLTLFFGDTDTPDQPGTFQNSQVRIENANPGHVTTVPGETITVDMNYCLSQVNIGFRALAGQFINPGVAAYGTFDGIDFRGEPARYTASAGIASGTPTSVPSDRGLVVVCLPQGSYSVRAFAQFQNPAGGFSSTELPSFNLEVGCRQVINPTLDLQLSLNSLPECAASSAIPVSGRVNSRGNVNRIFYTLNHGPEIDVCANCGSDPSFNFEATLANCVNEMTVTAVDEFGDEASATGFVRYDATPPVLSGCEDITAKVTGSATGATVNFAVNGTDNCNPTVQVTCVPPSGSFFPIGETTVTCTATDKCGNVGRCSFTVRVTANDPPVARCQDVTIFAGVNCSAHASINNVSYDPDAGDTITLSQSPAGPYPLGATVVTLTVTDDHGISSQCTATVTVVNPDPVVTLTSPASGSIYPVNTSVNFTATFTDAGGGTHTGTWMFDDLAQGATIVEPSGATSGSAAATYSFATPGVYSVKLTVTDACGGSATASQMNGMEVMVVIYDPTGGFVTGGGWINSPAGAYTADPSLTGKANFGFVSKYQNGATVPTGNTEFQFKAGDLNFKSSSYEWLVVAGAKAKYKGSGTINGASDYAFMLTTTDGQVSGGGGTDKFRIKIWDKSGGGVIYDNQPGDPETADASTSLGGGSIVIHKP